MQIGQKVIWTSFRSHPDVQEIFSGTVTKVGKETVWIDNKHKAEDQLYTAFIWPDLPETREHCQRIIDMKKRHKEEADQSMADTMKLMNKLVREGLK